MGMVILSLLIGAFAYSLSKYVELSSIADKFYEWTAELAINNPEGYSDLDKIRYQQEFADYISELEKKGYGVRSSFCHGPELYIEKNLEPEIREQANSFKILAIISGIIMMAIILL